MRRRLLALFALVHSLAAANPAAAAQPISDPSCRADLQLWLRSGNGGALALLLEGEVFTEDLGEISVRARVRGSAPSE